LEYSTTATENLFTFFYRSDYNEAALSCQCDQFTMWSCYSKLSMELDYIHIRVHTFNFISPFLRCNLKNSKIINIIYLKLNRTIIVGICRNGGDVNPTLVMLFVWETPQVAVPRCSQANYCCNIWQQN